MTPLEIPQEIIDAARKVEHWFEKQGIEHWQLCGVESRDFPAINKLVQEPSTLKGELSARIASIDLPSYGHEVLFIPVHKITLKILIAAAEGAEKLKEERER